jgi:tetratricopeptide (TPR) repeat protein
MKGKYVLFAVAALGCAIGITATVHQSEGNTPAASTVREIVVPLGDSDRSALAEGDTLRKAHKFREAIEAYGKAIDSGITDTAILAEAEYNIGLSHTWLGEYDKAGLVFNHMLAAYKDNPNAVGYAEYCLAWIEVQKGKYKEAVARLEKTSGLRNITDRELAARIRYFAGRTNLLFLNDPLRAVSSFRTIQEKYPDTNIARHPYIAMTKGK